MKGYEEYARYFTSSLEFRVGQFCDALASTSKDQRKLFATIINELLGNNNTFDSRKPGKPAKERAALLEAIQKYYPATAEKPDPLNSLLEKVRERGGRNKLHDSHRNHFFELASLSGTPLQGEIKRLCIDKAIARITELTRDNIVKDSRVCSFVGDMPGAIVTFSPEEVRNIIKKIKESNAASALAAETVAAYTDYIAQALNPPPGETNKSLQTLNNTIKEFLKNAQENPYPNRNILLGCLLRDSKFCGDIGLVPFNISSVPNQDNQRGLILDNIGFPVHKFSEPLKRHVEDGMAPALARIFNIDKAAALPLARAIASQFLGGTPDHLGKEGPPDHLGQYAILLATFDDIFYKNGNPTTPTDFLQALQQTLKFPATAEEINDTVKICFTGYYAQALKTGEDELNKRSVARQTQYRAVLESPLFVRNSNDPKRLAILDGIRDNTLTAPVFPSPAPAAPLSESAPAPTAVDPSLHKHAQLRAQKRNSTGDIKSIIAKPAAAEAAPGNGIERASSVPTPTHTPVASSGSNSSEHRSSPEKEKSDSDSASKTPPPASPPSLEDSAKQRREMTQKVTFDELKGIARTQSPPPPAIPVPSLPPRAPTLSPLPESPHRNALISPRNTNIESPTTGRRSVKAAFFVRSTSSSNTPEKEETHRGKEEKRSESRSKDQPTENFREAERKNKDNNHGPQTPSPRR